MLTQKDIDSPDGRFYPMQRRTIQTMSPTPGNGWGCIQPTDLVAMLRRVAAEEGKPVRITEGRAVKAITRAGVAVMGLLAILVTVHLLVWWAKP